MKRIYKVSKAGLTTFSIKGKFNVALLMLDKKIGHNSH